MKSDKESGKKTEEKNVTLSQETPDKSVIGKSDISPEIGHSGYDCPCEGCTYHNAKFTSMRAHSLRSHRMILKLDNDDRIIIGRKGEKTPKGTAPLRENPRKPSQNASVQFLFHKE